MDDIGIGETVGDGPTGIDRRSALKKAAVAGTVIWAAPTLLSSRVLADDSLCTPKCYPIARRNGRVSIGACHLRRDGAFASMGLENLVDCPCADEPTLSSMSFGPWNIADSPASVDNVDLEHVGNGILAVNIDILVSSPGDVAGEYSSTLTLTVSCSDRQGNVIAQTCEYDFTFDIEITESTDGCEVSHAHVFRIGCGDADCL